MSSTRNPQTLGPVCQRKLELERFKFPSSQDGGEMFFLETSGRSWLTPRETCALESAARFSGLRVNIILTSSFLDLYDNSTCYLYMFSSNIRFFTIKLRDAFRDTPLDRFYQREEYRRSEHKTTHLSDTLRYALVYKQGGFYSDLDTITIRFIASIPILFL